MMDPISEEWGARDVTEKNGNAKGGEGESPQYSPTTRGPRNVCAICLERHRVGIGQALFTAECGHVFHFNCITANVRHGHDACPLCRAAWSEVPWMAPSADANGNRNKNRNRNRNRNGNVNGIWIGNRNGNGIGNRIGNGNGSGVMVDFQRNLSSTSGYLYPIVRKSGYQDENVDGHNNAGESSHSNNVNNSDNDNGNNNIGVNSGDEDSKEEEGEEEEEEGEDGLEGFNGVVNRENIPESFLKAMDEVSSENPLSTLNSFLAAQYAARYMEVEVVQAEKIKEEDMGSGLALSFPSSPRKVVETAHSVPDLVANGYFRDGKGDIAGTVFNDDDDVDLPLVDESLMESFDHGLRISMCAETGVIPFEEVRECFTVLLTVKAPSANFYKLNFTEREMGERSTSCQSTKVVDENNDKKLLPESGLGTESLDLIEPETPTSKMDLDPPFTPTIIQVSPSYQSSQSHVPLDLVTVIDVSGSMAGKKIGLVQEAMKFIVSNLGEKDRLSIVAFSNKAWRVMTLKRMTASGKMTAVSAVESLTAKGGTNIADALITGSRILSERSVQNPVAAVMLLSDGQDTTTISSYGFAKSGHGRRAEAEREQYRRLIPKRETKPGGRLSARQIPIHTFGFGADHDPIAMHIIAEETGGMFSFVETEETVQDAFAQCIGGLLSVVVQDAKVSFVGGARGVKVAQVHSGSYEHHLGPEGHEGTVRLGDLYAEEERNILLEVWLPAFETPEEMEAADAAVSEKVLRARCSFLSKPLFQTVVRTKAEELIVARPGKDERVESVGSLHVDRQRNRLRVAVSITQANELAERGDLSGALKTLQAARETIQTSHSVKCGDGLSIALSAELKEMEGRLANQRSYETAGRAFLLSSQSSHSRERSSARGGGDVETYSKGYQTPSIVNMLSLSRASGIGESMLAYRPLPFAKKEMLSVFMDLVSPPLSPVLNSQSSGKERGSEGERERERESVEAFRASIGSHQEERREGGGSSSLRGPRPSPLSLKSARGGGRGEGEGGGGGGGGGGFQMSGKKSPARSPLFSPELKRQSPRSFMGRKKK